MEYPRRARELAREDFSPAIFCDFDGTITQVDLTDHVLTQLAHPSWREIEREWVLGTIGSRECLERQMALVEASRAELDEVIDSVAIDPGFADFTRFARGRGWPLYVLSEGFDYMIRRVLERARLARHFPNRIFSSGLRVEGRRLVVSFPHVPDPCGHGCANCKGALVRRLSPGRRPVVFVGDGMSDRYGAEAADVVFAKRHLLAHCREQGIACYPFETFKDVRAALGKLLAPAPLPRCRPAVAPAS